MNSNSKNPKVSVVMSVYNGEKYLREAVESILAQTFMNFEFIIINDGSTDRTGEILSSYNDFRIVILSQENKGLAPSLNRGIRKARGKYIARMDADDISDVERLRKQVCFLDEHPEYVIVGTNVVIMAEDGVKLYKTNLPQNDNEIRAFLTSGSPFYHGSVMFRREAVLKAKLYDEVVVQYFEDMLLWRKLSKLGKMANLPDALYYYRLVPSAIGILSVSLGKKRGEIIQKYLETGVLTKAERELLSTRPRAVSPQYKLGQYYFSTGNIYLMHDIDRNRARVFLLRSIKYWPRCGRPWFKLALSFLPSNWIRAWKRYREVKTHRIGLVKDRRPSCKCLEAKSNINQKYLKKACTVLNHVKKKYEICWVCTPLGTKGGTIKRLKLWAKYIDKNKFNVTFIFSSPEKEKILCDFSKYNIKLKNIPELRNRVLMYIAGTYRLVKEFKNNKYDLVHSMGIRSDILSGLASKIVGKQKILSYTAGLYPPTYNLFKKFIYKALFTLIKTEIDGFISLSQYTKNNLANDCNFPTQRIYVNKIGIDFEQFCVKDKRLDISTLTYGCAARLVTKGRGSKGIEYLIEAFNLLTKETKADIKLLIAGDGPLKEFLENMVFNLNLSDKIKFLGWMGNISNFMNKIDIFVLPSLIEGTPRSVLEAYYHCVPVIATSVGGTSEILQSGKTGFLVPPGNPIELKNKMKYFINYPEEIITMGKKARDYVIKNHNVKSEVSKLEDIYLSIINAKNEDETKIL